MLLYSQGSPTTDLSDDDLRAALRQALEQLGEKKNVLVIPPDFTRFHSRAGLLTVEAYDYYQENLKDVLPALGTHVPMPAHQLDEMFPGLPHDLVRPHRWRDDVVTIGEVPVNESHFIGAAYGMERMMGKANTPLRAILNKAEELFCENLPTVYVQTVVGPREDGSLATRGVYIGAGTEPFEAAAKLSVEVNFTQLEEEPSRMVCFLDPTEFHSTWLGNKAIYRTRMAIADEGKLTVLAPAVKEFGEDPEIDRLIRKYGYRTSPEVMDFVDQNEDLANNLSAAAHLIHGSSEGRFEVTYCPGHLTREEVEGVGYEYRDLQEALDFYEPETLSEGWNVDKNGERFYFIPNPALGLWAAKSRL